MKLDKPDKIQITARLSLHGTGGFYLSANNLISACKMLDKKDFVTLDGFNCYPVNTLSAILNTYDKQARVDVYPVTQNKRVDYWREIESKEEVESRGKYPEAHPNKYELAQRYEPVYNVLAIREHGQPSTQRIYSIPRADVTTFIAELTTEDVNIMHNTGDAWVNKAVADKKNIHEELEISGGNIASDGFRIHYSGSVYNQREYAKRDDCMKFISEARNNTNTISLDKNAARELIAGCKQAIKIKASLIKLSVNGRLDYTATDGETDVNGSISNGYQHAGDDQIIGINPKYLMDALDKPTQTTIKLKNAKSPLYLTDGTREAVIMPMRLG